MSKYYSLDKILSYNQKINIISGDRFGGKTTAVQMYAMHRAITTKCKSQFCVFVRYKDDIKELCPTYFNNTLLFYKDYELRFQADKFFLKKKSWSEERVVGYAFALNRATKKKSTSYPFIDTILFEEFLNIEGNYITRNGHPNLEVELFISLYETIARGNGKQIRENVRAFLISNAYYVNNQYYDYYDLIEKITSNPTKRFYRNKEKSVILEVTHNNIISGISKNENRGDKFEDLQNEIRLKKINVKKPVYQFTLNNKDYINATFYAGSLYFYTTKKNVIYKDAIIITSSPIAKLNYINIELFKTFDIARTIKKLFYANQLYYSSMSVYIKIKNIVEAL